MLGYPIFQILRSSFTNANILQPQGTTWVGFKNFIWLFTDPTFRSALLKSTIFVIGSVLLKVSFGLMGALLLNKKKLAGRGLFRTLVVLPWGIPFAISAMMWGWFLHSDFGFLAGILKNIGLAGPFSFLGSSLGAMGWVIVLDAWLGLPFMIITYLAGLQSLPYQLYEAAKIDGASAYQCFRYITVPGLKPVLLTGALVATVWTFNAFAPIWVLTGGGPASATTTMPIAIFKNALENITGGGLGKARALSVAQVLIVSVIAYFYYRQLVRGD